MSLEEKLLSDKCDIPAVAMKPKMRTVFANRDFPPNCGPAKGLSFQVLDNYKIQGSTDHLKSTTHIKDAFESEPKTKVEQLPSFSQDASDNARLLGPLKTEVCETTRLPYEVQQIATKVPPPWRRISAKRTFPPGCGRKTLQADYEVAPKSTVQKTSRSDQKIATMEEIRERGQQKTISLGVKKGEMQQKDRNKCQEGNLSEHISKNSSHYTIPGSGHRVIVQALMAAPNCPWRNSTRGKIKPNKH